MITAPGVNDFIELGDAPNSYSGANSKNVSVNVTATGLEFTTGSAGSTTYSETPSGTIDGINKDFTAAHSMTFVFGIFMNGQFIHPADYSFLTTTISFVVAPDISFAGSPFTVIYN